MNGFHDVGGTATIHMMGGSAGLMAALIAGKRKRRFEENDPMDKLPSVTHNVYGTLLLIVLWFSFNAAYTAGASTP